MSKEELKVKPVNNEVTNDDLKKVHGGVAYDGCSNGIPDGKGGFKKIETCDSNS